MFESTPRAIPTYQGEVFQVLESTNQDYGGTGSSGSDMPAPEGCIRNIATAIVLQMPVAATGGVPVVVVVGEAPADQRMPEE